MKWAKSKISKLFLGLSVFVAVLTFQNCQDVSIKKNSSETPQASLLPVLSPTPTDTIPIVLGLDGKPIAQVDPSIMTSGSNYCYVDQASRPAWQGNNTGPCGASPVAVNSGGLGLSKPIANSWLLDLKNNTINGDDCSGSSGGNLAIHIQMRPLETFSVKIHTPKLVNNCPVHLGFGMSTTTIGAEVPTFITLTPTRSDFSYTKLDQPNGCYRSIGGSENSLNAIVTPSGTSTFPAGECGLTPDTDYYFNIRMEAASGASRGIEACDTRFGTQPVCGLLLGIQNLK